MMTEAKFKNLNGDVADFIQQLPNPSKQADAHQLVTLFQEITGLPPVLWSHGIIGFGTYHYRYASGREGDMPLAAFAPRKAKHSIYVMPDFPQKEQLLAQLGKHQAAKGCLYINKLADIDLDVLRKIITASISQLQ